MTASVDAPSGVRLRAARKMAGLSMDELARRLGGIVTKQAIAKYETGQMRPSPEVLERLAQVLDIPPEIPAGVEARAESEKGPQNVLHEDLCYMIVSKSAGTLDETLEGAPGDKPDVLPGASPSRPLPETPVAMSRRAPGPFARLLHPHAKGARTEGADLDETKVLLADKLSANEELRCARVSAPQASRELRDVVRAYEPAEQARPLDFSSVRFRERSPIPAKLESALRYTIADRMNRLMAVESMLGARVVFRNPLGGAAAPATGAEVERAAAAVREAWGLGESPVPNLLGLLEEKGLSVCEVGGFEEFDGLSAAFGSRTVIVVNPDVAADRVRFTAAHELAHVLGVAGAGPETAEGLCHEFAGAFLLPRGPLARLMTPAGRKVALADLAELKRTYGVSLQAIMRRAHALGLATDRQLRRFRETFKERGWYEVEPVEFRGTEKAIRFRRLLNFAVAEDILNLERAAALAGVAPEEFRKDMGDIF